MPPHRAAALMAYRLRALTEVRLHPAPVPAGAVFETARIGFACALSRQGLAEPADGMTAADVELGHLLQDIAQPDRAVYVFIETAGGSSVDDTTPDAWHPSSAAL